MGGSGLTIGLGFFMVNAPLSHQIKKKKAFFLPSLPPALLLVVLIPFLFHEIAYFWVIIGLFHLFVLQGIVSLVLGFIFYQESKMIFKAFLKGTLLAIGFYLLVFLIWIIRLSFVLDRAWS